MRWGLRARAAAAAGESRSYVISVWDDDERGGELSVCVVVVD